MEAVRGTVTLPGHLQTVDEYRRMGKVGLLNTDASVELIKAKIVETPPAGDAYAGIRTDSIACWYWPSANTASLPLAIRSARARVAAAVPEVVQTPTSRPGNLIGYAVLRVRVRG